MPDIFIGESQKPIKEEDAQTLKEDSKTPKNTKEQPATPTAKKKLDHNHSHIFTSYCERPPTIHFEDSLEDEELLLFLRKHFVTNIPWILKAVIAGLIPLILGLINSLGIINLDFLPSGYAWMILVFFYYLIFGYIFVNYLTWFYNISLVTTQRIIDIDFSSIVFENVAATKLTQVEDVSYTQVGVIRSVFDYGDVLAQTAAHVDEFEFLAVPHPEKVINIINGLIGESNNA